MSSTVGSGSMESTAMVMHGECFSTMVRSSEFCSTVFHTMVRFFKMAYSMASRMVRNMS